MFNPPKITLLYSGIMALFYLGLSNYVIYWRLKEKRGLGSDNDPKSPLFRSIRIHGNFSEFIPFILFLMALDEMTYRSVEWLHVYGIVLVVGRILHLWGLTLSDGTSVQRFSGAFVTFTLLFVLGVLLIVKGLA